MISIKEILEVENPDIAGLEQLEQINANFSNASEGEWSFQGHFSLLSAVLIECLRELRSISNKIDGQTAMIGRFFIK